MLILDALARAAATWPHKSALVDEHHMLTWGEVAEQVETLARRIARDTSPGDRVLVIGPSAVHTAIAHWAVWRARAVLCPVHPGTPPAGLLTLLEDCEPTLVIALGGAARMTRVARDAGRALTLFTSITDNTAVESEPLGPMPTGPELATIIYTSGSRGRAKGVCVSHDNMAFSADAVQQTLAYHHDDQITSALPLSFSYGLYQPLLASLVGARLRLEASLSWPSRVLDRLEADNATVFPGVPTTFARLAALNRAAPSVRLITSAAAPFPAGQLGAVRHLFPNAELIKMYGQTECKRISALPSDEHSMRPDSVGLPLPGTDAFVVDETDQPVKPGTVGELHVRGPHVMRGYWRAPELTAKTLYDDAQGRAVLRTGDLFRADEAGYLYFVSRKDDMILTGGNKVAPATVENVLSGHPAVSMCAVAGLPDEVLGERVVAWVVPAEGTEPAPAELRRWCRSRLRADMVPTEIRIRGGLPLNARGKVDVRALITSDTATLDGAAGR